MVAISILLAFLLVASAITEDAASNYYSGLINDGLNVNLRGTKRGGISEVSFFLYTRQTLDNPTILLTQCHKRSITQFDISKPTKVIIHGWRSHESSLLDTLLKNAYLSVADYNVIVVDWSRHGSSSYNYMSAKNNLDDVADHVALFLDHLSSVHGLRLEDLHVLGHSLGAHISGLAGTKVTSGRIGRITGFDPAGPMFDSNSPYGRLSTDSALFVDVIHTCTNMLGMKAAIGHVDFYPNGGGCFQPGCGADIAGVCSHSRSYQYYAETIGSLHSFPAVSCGSWNDYKMQLCDYENIVFMGEGISKSTRGVYFLPTNKESPFGIMQ